MRRSVESLRVSLRDSRGARLIIVRQKRATNEIRICASPLSFGRPPISSSNFRPRTTMSEQVSEYERERREKLERLRQLGVDPYGQRTTDIKPLAEIKAAYKADMGHDAGPVVTGAGRVMFQKRFGKLAFLTLRDE